MDNSIIDTHELDELLSNLTESDNLEDLVGLEVDWHWGHRGKTVIVANEIAIELALPCGECGKILSPIYVVSGLHSGAFCYVVNSKGEHIANLRDDILICRGGCDSDE